MTHPGWSGLGYVDPEAQDWWQIIQPGVVLAKMRELNTQNSALNASVRRNAASIDVSLVDLWNGYYTEWNAFFADNQGWWDRFSSAVVDQLRTFINRSNSFESRMRDHGVDPGTLDPGETTGDTLLPIPTWGWVIIGLGGVAVGAYALYTLSRVLREGRLIATVGTAGIGGPTRVDDLDGPSTYNLEIER